MSAIYDQGRVKDLQGCDHGKKALCNWGHHDHHHIMIIDGTLDSELRDGGVLQVVYGIYKTGCIHCLFRIYP
jgi:hypothetical protein